MCGGVKGSQNHLIQKSQGFQLCERRRAHIEDWKNTNKYSSLLCAPLSNFPNLSARFLKHFKNEDTPVRNRSVPSVFEQRGVWGAGSSRGTTGGLLLTGSLRDDKRVTNCTLPPTSTPEDDGKILGEDAPPAQPAPVRRAPAAEGGLLVSEGGQRVFSSDPAPGVGLACVPFHKPKAHVADR